MNSSKQLANNNKNAVGFGIKQVTRNEKLHFYGTPYKEVEGEKLVVQVLTKSGMILREISIEGDIAGSREKDPLLKKVVVENLELAKPDDKKEPLLQKGAEKPELTKPKDQKVVVNFESPKAGKQQQGNIRKVYPQQPQQELKININLNMQ